MWKGSGYDEEFRFPRIFTLDPKEGRQGNQTEPVRDDSYEDNDVIRRRVVECVSEGMSLVCKELLLLGGRGYVTNSSLT